ncbi:uncharacterized protein [Watersipora subatra]
MTDVINRISALKAKVNKHQKLTTVETRSISTQATTVSCSNNAQESNKPKHVSTQPLQPGPNSGDVCGFGGMKKGFLAGGLESKKQAAANASNGKVSDNAVASASDVPHIKSDPSKTGDHLVMQEVQRMRDQLQKTDAWLTEDLLNKLGNNDKLMTMMADPRCERALQEFQANPDKALITYQHDKYIQEFFREFCDVLGNHYENLHEASIGVVDNVKGAQKAPPTTERKEELIKEVKSTRRQTTAPKSHQQLKKEDDEDAKVKQVLSNPELVEILQSENIMELIRSLKDNPSEAQRLLLAGGKEFQEKVKTLVDAGLLAFQRKSIGNTHPLAAQNIQFLRLNSCWSCLTFMQGRFSSVPGFSSVSSLQLMCIDCFGLLLHLSY